MERLEKNIVIMMSLSCRLKMLTLENDATATTNYSNYLDTQTIDFTGFLPFSIVFIPFVQTAENDMKMM